jgi:hypothetical protein
MDLLWHGLGMLLTLPDPHEERTHAQEKVPHKSQEGGEGLGRGEDEVREESPNGQARCP